jgi:hypothetical protein
MKLFFTVLIIVCISSSSNAQAPKDSSLATLWQRVENIDFHLQKFTKEYHAGITMTAIAAAFTAVTIAAFGENDPAFTPSLIGCGILGTAGIVVTIDAHKWIGRGYLSKGDYH